MDSKTKVMALKMLPESRLKSFLDGDLYMNSAAYFKKLESGDAVRADQHEGLEWARQVAEVSVQDDGKWIPIGGLINPVTYSTEKSADFNMFCMYMFTDQLDDPFDGRNLGFGDAFALITNLPEFIRRVRLAANALERPFGHGPVEYVDPKTHDGPMGAFRKFTSYSYQNEFRLAIEGGNGEPITLKIGDIRDITFIGQTNNLATIIEQIKRQHSPQP